MSENTLFDKVYNPDVLSCLANLSNDEVFTPPEIVNQMLDMLPQELFKNPDTKFLDPACKTGVFLREIAKRLIAGLEPQFPDLQERIDHIFKNQLFGIAITELTSLLSRRGVYCSKYPNSEFSVCKFNTADGNIRFKRIPHTWGKTTYDKNNKPHASCIFCGANKEQYDRGDLLETHAYEFIHTLKAEELFNMKFDVIIGNPPYQLNTGDKTSTGAIPLYNKFIEQAKKLQPRYLSMIVPARWYAGGIGLDNFRKTMLTEQKLRYLVDYPNSKDCFSGVSVSGGICYFLWERDYCGPCQVTNVTDKRSVAIRYLDEFETFVRYNDAIDILHKIKKQTDHYLPEIISTRNPFNFSTSERGVSTQINNGIRLYSSAGFGWIDKGRVVTGLQCFDKYKVAISRATSEHAGEAGSDGKFKVIPKMNILNPSDVCTASYFLVGVSDSLNYTINTKKYIETNFVRFLVLQAISSINLSRESFKFVPLQDFSKPWTDEELYRKYNLTQEEIDFIESMIRPME